VGIAAPDISTAEAQVVAAVALIVVSGLAAWAAYWSYKEARRTREQAARPVLALDLVPVTETYVEVGIVNVGQGAAINARLQLAFLPVGADVPVRNWWVWPLIRPGQSYQFAPPNIDGTNRPNFETWAALYPQVTLTGTVWDQLGNIHGVALDLTDLVGLRALAAGAGLASPLRETAEQRDLKSAARSAEEISDALERVASAQEKRRRWWSRRVRRSPVRSRGGASSPSDRA
jgi:hypothetical protein